VARLTGDGSPDTSFSDDGLLTFNFPDFPRAYATAVAVQGDGKIVPAGYAEVAGQAKFAVARLNGDGSFDTSFSDNGSSSRPRIRLRG
jgi:uncharacterized delta-60 repeat protein